MPLRKVTISDADVQAARYEMYEYPCKIVRRRMTVISMKAAGMKHSCIATACNVSYGTVKNYLDLYEKEGIEGLKQVNYKHPKSKLDEYSTSLKVEFSERPPLTAKEARERIRNLTGVNLSLGRVRAFLHRIGMSIRKAGHIPAKADIGKQKEFHDKTLMPLIKKCKKGKGHLLFMDSAHFVLAPYVAMMWCFARTFVPSSAGRFRLNVLAVVHAQTKKITGLANDSYVNALTVCELLRSIKVEYADKPIYIVLDNARYQHCKLVKDLAIELNINLVFLPPYSPNLNLIERLWKYVKSEVCNGKYYADKTSFENAILDFLNNTHKKEILQELKSRLALKFQLFTHQQKLTA